MTTWLTIGLCIAVFGFGAIADNVEVDFPENVNSRMGGSRIVSGWEAYPGQWSWQLNMRMVNAVGGVTGCGGSVIHSSWAMTAAHCTAGRNVIIVRAGLVNMTQPEYFGEVTEWYNHPTYNDALPGVVQVNDISIMKLQRALTFSDNLKPIRIQRSEDMNKNYEGLRLVASGWGLTWTQGSAPENLNWVYQLGQSNAACQQTYGTALIVPSTICTVYYNVSSQSTCQGDSGGPLVYQEEDSEWTLIGAASFVSGQGCHVLPAGFCRTGHFHDWYQEVTGINFDWNWNESSSSEEEPAKSSSEEPASSSSEEPAKSSSEEPASSSSEEPAKSSSEEPASSSSEEPAKSSSEEPASSSSEEPAKSSSEEPASSSSEEPAKSSSEEPASSSSEEPAESSSEEPASSSSEEPAESSSEEPASSSSEEPAKSSSEEPASSSSEPAKSSSEEPASSSSEEPAKSSSEEPASSSSEPAKSSSEEPASSSSEEPAKSSSEEPAKSSSEEEWPSEEVTSEEEESRSFWSWFGIGRSDRI